MRTGAADGEQARNASALKWDTHLPAHVSWLEAWPEAEKQPSHAVDDALPRCLLNCNSFPTLRFSLPPRFPLGGLPSAVSGDGQRAQMRWGGRVRSEAACARKAKSGPLLLKIMGVRRERQGSEARSPGLRPSGTGKEGTTTGNIVIDIIDMSTYASVALPMLQQK